MAGIESSFLSWCTKFNCGYKGSVNTVSSNDLYRLLATGAFLAGLALGALALGDIISLVYILQKPDSISSILPERTYKRSVFFINVCLRWLLTFDGMGRGG